VGFERFPLGFDKIHEIEYAQPPVNYFTIFVGFARPEFPFRVAQKGGTPLSFNQASP
jgi:hypothetical protein